MAAGESDTTNRLIFNVFLTIPIEHYLRPCSHFLSSLLTTYREYWKSFLFQHRLGVDEQDETTVSNPDARFDPPYRYGEKRSLKKIRDIARNRDRTQYLPHMGDSTERNWIEAMMCITKHKTRKLALPGFAKHLRNWLLIYDNWSPAIHESHRHHVAEPLAQQLYNGGWRNPFEKILILRGTPAV